jgi:acyl dehydratase
VLADLRRRVRAILCTESALKKHGFDRSRAVKVMATVVRSASARSYADYENGCTGRRRSRPSSRPASRRARSASAELHDASAVGELMLFEGLGLRRKGTSGILAERGETTIGGSIPVNPSGGLESKGHPIGATGLGQIFELVEQLRGNCGPRQVEGRASRSRATAAGCGAWKSPPSTSPFSAAPEHEELRSPGRPASPGGPGDRQQRLAAGRPGAHRQVRRGDRDDQWIHVDPERARKGPFGAPIAHGFLTLSLLPGFFKTAFEIRNSTMGVNYGLNKVRFLRPVPVDSRLRGHFKLLAWEADRQRRRPDADRDVGRAGRRLQAGVRGRVDHAALSLISITSR